MSQSKDDLSYELEQINESSKRSRFVLYLLLISSFCFFTIDWNTDDGSWFNSKIALRGRLADYLQARTLHRPLTEEQQKQEHDLQNAATLVYKDYQLDGFFSPTPEPDWILNSKTAEFQKGLDKLRSSEGNFDSFKVPFLDVVFDSDDLGLFSSIHIFILLSIFYYCLVREKRNVEIGFEKATKADGKKALGEFYTRATMQQVLTIPPGTTHLHWLFSKTIRAFYLIPALFQIKILLGDISCDSILAGYFVNPVRYVVQMAVEFILIGLIVFETTQIYKVCSATDQKWMEQYKKSRP